VSRFFLATAGAALILPVLTRGSYRKLLGGRWHWGSLLFFGLALQFAAGLLDPPASGVHRFGFGVLVASYVLVLGFVLRNAVRTGMMIVAIGIAANFVAIVVNQGMPVEVPNDWIATGGVTTTVKHHPATSDDSMRALSDIIVLRDLDEVISFGDLILAAGMLNVTFHASRKPRTLSKRTKRIAAIQHAETQIVDDEPFVESDPIDANDDHDDDHDERDVDEVDLTEAPPKPPSPIVAGVIEELTELRRAARDRHPSAVFGALPLVGRYSDAGSEPVSAMSGSPQSASPQSASGDNELERFEHATVIHISGAGIQGLQREPGA
jgi:hypothetical protein